MATAVPTADAYSLPGAGLLGFSQNDEIAQPTKLFIGGISRRTTTKQLREHFAKYGQIFDCVAMRQPDGRPRGFGYVTLESPSVADQVLKQPQIIDDRLVDVKVAVPDSSSGKEAVSVSEPRVDDHSVTDWHHPSYVVLQDPSIYSDLGAGRAQPKNCVDLQRVVYNTGPLQGCGLGCADWNSGCEDVLLVRSGAAVSEMSNPSVKVPPPGRVKVPLGEVTNIILGDSLHHDDSQKMVKFTPLLNSDMSFKRPEVREHRSMELDSFGRDMDDIWVDQNSPRESKQSSESGNSVARVFEPRVHAGLPSLGSVHHATGDCRRCNFFAKGRCRNGLNCQFCHFEHSRPKMSRQEKRELHATRQIDTEVEEVVPMVDRIPLPPGLFSPFVQPDFSRNLQSTVATQTESFACSHCRRLGSDNRK
jgi:RNA recognition motif-containing protein